MIAAIVQRKTSDLRLVKATIWTVLTAFTCLFFKSQQRLAASINQQTGANSVLNKKCTSVYIQPMSGPQGFVGCFSLRISSLCTQCTAGAHQGLLAELRRDLCKTIQRKPMGTLQFRSLSRRNTQFSTSCLPIFILILNLLMILVGKVNSWGNGE